ncbi:hypothetical protein M407DRAFT_118240 [Tulasnella calospora MUT 4182]|uniref:Uncharacterized protein n=1 Tax=Tulasnella calospora MUT 4182 TaxID=1051891 RepID=A0A0C3QU89_9AGAM|nr:hypothetical protein M407DRAFT_118240 [Tulasnella calospora MUT 4182]
MAYLCGDFSIHGVYTWTRDVSRAATVKHSPEAQSLEVLVGDIAQCYIGAQFWFESQYTDLGKGGQGYLEVTPVKSTPAGYRSSLKQSNGQPGRGQILFSIWDVGINGALFPHVSQQGVRYCLHPCIFNSTNSLGLTSDFVAFSRLWGANVNHVEKVDLLFEAL